MTVSEQHSLADLVVAGRPLTALEVARLPDDERYELIDGVVSVVPGPSFEHQTSQMNLVLQLAPALPPAYRMLVAPFDILSEDTVVQPDLIVMDRAWRGGEWLETVPHLIVEILSPSTAVRDLTTKFRLYQRSGVPSYWVLDPIKARLIVWELDGGSYQRIADVGSGETWRSSRPFEVTIDVDRLLD